MGKFNRRVANASRRQHAIAVASYKPSPRKKRLLPPSYRTVKGVFNYIDRVIDDPYRHSFRDLRWIYYRVLPTISGRIFGEVDRLHLISLEKNLFLVLTLVRSLDRERGNIRRLDLRIFFTPPAAVSNKIRWRRGPRQVARSDGFGSRDSFSEGMYECDSSSYTHSASNSDNSDSY